MASRQRGNESLVYVKLPLVWRVADVLALPCISKTITCVLLGKLFLLLKLYIILFYLHLLGLKPLCAC